MAAAHGVGLSSFVSMGAKADLSANDLLHFWEQDACHRRRFCSTWNRSATHAASGGSPAVWRRAKPVIAVKSGLAIGPSGAESQTGALLTATGVSVDALFRHAGVIRTDTVTEMFDVAALLTHQPLPRR